VVFLAVGVEERPKAEALGYLDAKAKAEAAQNYERLVQMNLV
jgi:hypothetical protein